MQIWPAIDLRGGKCVRLEQGDYDRETVFADDPATVAREFVERGAKCLHLVDLDGARDGRPANREAIAAIVQAISNGPGGIPLQLGGGIRDEATIGELLALGLRRLVLGTKAVREPDWFRRVCRKYPGRLVLGIDARDGRVATDGWLQTSDVPATQLARELASEPLAAIVYTDIARDGMLAGPNLAAMREMREAVDISLIASGGVSNADDVAKLAAIGMDGCIIGKAFYCGAVTIEAALEASGV